MNIFKKSLLLMLSLACAVMTLSCSENDPLDESTPITTETANLPALIAEDFVASFPKATSIDWEIDSMYASASFTLRHRLGENLEMGVWYNLLDQKKKLVSTEVAFDSIPDVVMNSINVNYSGYQINYISYVETASNGNYYEVGLKTNRNSLKVKFDEQGNVLAEYGN